MEYYTGRVLDASLSASASPDCSLKMALILSNVRMLWLSFFNLLLYLIYFIINFFPYIHLQRLHSPVWLSCEMKNSYVLEG